MRRVDKDKIILNILKEGAKTRRELCIESIKRGISESTAYRHIDKLIILGSIKEGKCELVQQIKEANHKEVNSVLELLINEENGNVVYSRLKQLTIWAYNKRVANIPKVIRILAELLEKEIIIKDEKNLNQLFEVLNAILFFEQTNQGEQWEKLAEILVNDTIEKAYSLLLESPNSRIIEYLGRTNRDYAVNIIFEFMTKHNVEVNKNEFSHIVYALNKDRLSKKHNKLIGEKLDDFLRSGDERLINLATMIREKIT